MMHKRLLLIICATVMPLKVFSADLTAKVDNHKIAYGETVNLRLSYEGNDGGNLQPDLSVLQDNFNIYSTSSSMNTNIINGAVSQKREWLITMLPQNAGKQTIPSISVGNYKSLPVEIEVLSAENVEKEKKKQNGSKSDVAQMASFAAELQVNNKNPYIEQEVSAVLTIRSNRNLQFNSEPYFENSDDWIIKRVGNSAVSQDNGEMLTKLNYVFYPQKSGKQDLPRAVVEGFYVTYENSTPQNIGGGLLQFFDMDMGAMFGVQKPVLFKSKTETIDVKPIPSAYTAQNWLPAEKLVAEAKWVDNNPEFKVGETIAREIAITALGVSEKQLPELELKENSAWKQYPEKPQYSSSVYENQLISQEIIRVVYIPQKSGNIQLPKIEIPWFNVKTQKNEKVVINAEDVEVMPNEQYETLQSEPAQTQEVEKNIIDTSKTDNKTIAPVKQTYNSIIILAIIGAFLSGLLISFLLFGRRKNNFKAQKSEDYRKNVRHALLQGDYHRARDSLVKWGESAFPNLKINNLKDLSDAIKNENFTEQCDVINALLYGKSEQKPNVDIVIKTMTKHAKDGHNKEEIILPKLYK
ncbi:MAG: BatD family protein [Alphaproteobacteria bacterium]|nr:BatD family protein [Alphaproteobacteria bacterium]